MNTARLDTRTAPSSPTMPRAAGRLLDLLAQIDAGQLRVELPNGEAMLLGQADAHGRPPASLRIHHWKLFDDVLARGDIGFGEAYIDGHFDAQPGDFLQVKVIDADHHDLYAEIA